MDGGAADERQTRVVPRLEHRPLEMTSLPIPDELIVEIFLKLLTLADLARASATCLSFRRVTADRSFLRLYRKIHAPPLLGFLDMGKNFHPAVPPHPSAPAASAVALAADFSFSFLPAHARNWALRDTRDGRVLLYRPSPHGIDIFEDMVVCDPLHRRYLLLPPIPYDLASSVEDPPLSREIFLVSPGDGDEAGAAEETSFRVVWMAQCNTRLVAFSFSSNTGQWRAISSQRWSDLSAGLPPSTPTPHFYSRHYVHGCFYWLAPHCKGTKSLVLDTKTMEFSIAETPFIYSQWQKARTISLPSVLLLRCDMERHLLVRKGRGSKAAYFTLDIETFKVEKVCTLHSSICVLKAYSNFPPSLFSSPTVSSGIREDAEKPMLEQDAEVLPGEAHHQHDQNATDKSAGGHAGESRIGDGAD